MAPKLKMIYFPLEGRGEVVRILCLVGGIKLEEEPMANADWPEKKPTMPYRGLPILIIDEKTILPQTIAICRYIARLARLNGKDDVEAAEMDAIVDAMNECWSDIPMIFVPTIMNAKGFQEIKNTLIAQRGDAVKKFIGHPEMKTEAYKDYAKKAVNPKLDRFEEMLRSSKSGWLVGDKMSWADVYVAEFMHRMTSHVEPRALDDYPKVKAMMDKVYSNQAVANFKRKGPQYEF